MTWDMTHKDWIDSLKPHVGHHLECLGCNSEYIEESYWIVCVDCDETLIDTDDYKDKEE